MDVKELATIFRNHVHSGNLPDAKRLPDSAIIGSRFQPAIVLRSPSGSRWLVTVTDKGVIGTESAGFSHVLVAPDGTRFTLDAATDGAIVISSSDTRFNSVIESDGLYLVDPAGGNWLLSVDDVGALYVSSV